jgi:hypothetical protein
MGPSGRLSGMAGFTVVWFGQIVSVLASLSLAFLGIGRGSSVWIPAMLVGVLFFPLVNSSSQAIWQAKVPPDLAGARLFFPEVDRLASTAGHTIDRRTAGGLRNGASDEFH